LSESFVTIALLLLELLKTFTREHRVGYVVQ